MATELLQRSVTTADLLALPNDGIDRWLVRGELREKPNTLRNRFHSKVVMSLGAALKIWRDQQPEPRGEVVGGEAGFRLVRDPDTTVGIDIAYVSPEVMARQTSETTLIEGVPLLAVEVISPSDTNEEMNEKIDLYLAAGVALIWYVDPRRRTATVYQPGQAVCTINENEVLSGGAVLSGFHVMLGELFR